MSAILLILLAAAGFAVYQTTKKETPVLEIDEAKPLWIMETDFETMYYHFDGKTIKINRYQKENKVLGTKAETPPKLKHDCARYSWGSPFGFYSSLFQKENVLKLRAERYSK